MSRKEESREYYQRTKARRQELKRLNYAQNKERYYQVNRRSAIKRKYGLTEEQYIRMLHEQDFSCLICGGEEVNRTLAVDHNHETGEVRGLLCGPCNRGLGLFKDSPDLLIKAANYLRGD